MLAARMRLGQTIVAAAFDSTRRASDRRSHQANTTQSGDTTEIVGVGTLPSARRRAWPMRSRGYSSLTPVRGIETIFLSAGDDDVARILTRIGFRRVGTALVAGSPVRRGSSSRSRRRTIAHKKSVRSAGLSPLRGVTRRTGGAHTSRFSMHPTVRMLLVGVIVASFAASSRSSCATTPDRTPGPWRAVVSYSLRLRAGAGAGSGSGSGGGQQAVTNNAPMTTISAASPSTPLTNPTSVGNSVGNPVGNSVDRSAGNSLGSAADSTGKPASFWALTLTYPTYCAPGTSVAPVLSWNAADTDTVAVSVDAPTTVGGYGFFDSIGTLTMPSIACIGAKGIALPTHEYEIDAFGTDHTRLHVVLKVDVTVSPNLISPARPRPDMSRPLAQHRRTSRLTTDLAA